MDAYITMITSKGDAQLLIWLNAKFLLHVCMWELFSSFSGLGLGPTRISSASHSLQFFYHLILSG